MADKITRSVLVTGSTGHQGRTVARALLMRGHHVRAFTRFPNTSEALRLRQLGAEIAQGDFEDLASLKDAMEGVSTVFAVGTPYEGGPQTEVEEVSDIFGAARAMKVKHLVYSSVASANRDTGIPFYESKKELERRLKLLGVPWTVLAPTSFMENLWGQPTLRRGFFTWGIPGDVRMQQLALNDLAHVTAEVMELREPFFDERIEVASDELTGEEAAAILSRVSGIDISYSTQAPEEIAGKGEAYQRMLRWLAQEGDSVDIEALKQRFPLVRFHSYEDWAREQDWSFLYEARRGGGTEGAPAR